jgi:hypothetical protein
MKSLVALSLSICKFTSLPEEMCRFNGTFAESVAWVRQMTSLLSNKAYPLGADEGQRQSVDSAGLGLVDSMESGPAFDPFETKQKKKPFAEINKNADIKKPNAKKLK